MRQFAKEQLLLLEAGRILVSVVANNHINRLGTLLLAIRFWEETK
jgi:hypothetical protein